MDSQTLDVGSSHCSVEMMPFKHFQELAVCVFICGLQLYSDKGSFVFLFVMENKTQK